MSIFKIRLLSIILLILSIVSLAIASEDLPDPSVITSKRVGLKAEKKQYSTIFKYLVPKHAIYKYCLILKNILLGDYSGRRVMADFQLDIGLFLSEVILHKTLKEKQNLNSETANYIYNLLSDLKKQRDFNFKSSQEESHEYFATFTMFTALRNFFVEDYWVQNIEKLSVVSIDPSSVNDTYNVYKNWETYTRLVNLSMQPEVNTINENGIRNFMTMEHIGKNLTNYMNQSKTNPLFTINEYRTCAEKLIIYYNKDKDLKARQNHSKFPQCVNLDSCTKKIKNGRYWGIELSNRLFILLLAKYAFRCKFTEDDQVLLDQMCSYAYNEAYLSGIEKNIKDERFIILTQVNSIMFCTIEGHALFLRMPWLEFYMQFLSTFGCFDFELKKTLSVNDIHSLDSGKPDYVQQRNRFLYRKRLCNAGLTSAMAAIAANTIRFILETYY